MLQISFSTSTIFKGVGEGLRLWVLATNGPRRPKPKGFGYIKKLI
jgi:hypothetical protein